MLKIKNTSNLPYVPVKYIPREGERELAILEDGQVVLYADPVYQNDPRKLQTYLQRDVDKFLSPLPKDVYIRVNDHIEDFEHLKSKTHKGSINHFNNTPEGGLSVAKDVEWYAKYIYYVQGEQIGKGSDGEPILKIDTVKLISKKPMTLKQFNTDFKKRQQKRIKELGLTDDEARLLKSMAKIETGAN